MVNRLKAEAGGERSRRTMFTGVIRAIRMPPTTPVGTTALWESKRLVQRRAKCAGKQCQWGTNGGRSWRQRKRRRIERQLTRCSYGYNKEAAPTARP
jgi:hypothetical protein